jgi:hypothetical protein
MEMDTKVFWDPRLEIRVLDSQQLAVLLDKRFCKEDWTSIFQDMEQGIYPEWLLSAQSLVCPNLDETATVEDVLALKWPKQASNKTGIFDIFPALSYDDDDVSLGDTDTVGIDAVQTSIAEFKHRFSCLKQKWTTAFQDVEVGHLLVTTDLEQMSGVTNKLMEYVGLPLAIDGTLFTNVWQALSKTNIKLQEGITQVQDNTSYLSDLIEDISSNTAVIQDAQLMLQTTLASIQDTLRKHDSRFGKILPILMNVDSPASSASLSELDHKLSKLSQSIEEL